MNPDDAQRCDCGCDFQSGQVASSDLNPINAPELKPPNAEVIAVAKAQKQILWLILANIGAMIVAMAAKPTGGAVAGIIGNVLALVVVVFIAVTVYRLAGALKLTAWVYVILMFIPCISLLTLLHLNSKATAHLRANGIRVGLMGARKADLAKFE
jgi:hypothetical protein